MPPGSCANPALALGEASDRWLIPHLTQMEVELELGSNRAVKRVVAAGLGLGCLSRLAVKEAIAEGGWWSLPPPCRRCSAPFHRAAPGEEAGRRSRRVPAPLHDGLTRPGDDRLFRSMRPEYCVLELQAGAMLSIMRPDVGAHRLPLLRTRRSSPPAGCRSLCATSWTAAGLRLSLLEWQALPLDTRAELLHLPAGADFALCAPRRRQPRRACGNRCAWRFTRSPRRWTAIPPQPVLGSRLRRRLRTMFSAGGIGLEMGGRRRSGARCAVKRTRTSANQCGGRSQATRTRAGGGTGGSPPRSLQKPSAWRTIIDPRDARR